MLFEMSVESKSFAKLALSKLTAYKAGAIAEDALRSIIISQQLLGTKEIVLVKHTGCGMLTFKEEDAKHIVEANLGWVDPPSSVVRCWRYFTHGCESGPILLRS